jgi:hypothetical protein
MADTAHVLDVLFGKESALWRSETRHEAMLLMRALYKTDVGSRQKIIAAILLGPPTPSSQEEKNHEVEAHVFEVLAFLESEGLPLTAEAQEKLAAIRDQHPKWTSRKYPGMSVWFESGWVDKTITVDDVKLLAPGDVPNKIINFEEEWNRSRRDLCEAIGVEIAHNPQWGLRVLVELKLNVQNLPEDSINPILWGIRATITDNTNKLDNESLVIFLETTGSMIKERPIPSMWSSLPSVLRDLVGKLKVPIGSLSPLGFFLASVFQTFDYERDTDEKPIDWLRRAINHPYGDLTELYLLVAQEYVNAQSKAEKPLALDPDAEKFFAHTLSHYDIGSRYGLCLIAQRLSWIEAVAPKFSNSLYPAFAWTNGDEQPLVAWSGYFWANTLARYLVENFETTYIPAARRYFEFASSERRGLASHVSAVFWFYPDRVDLLYQFASAVDSELRVKVLNGWKNHLENASDESAKKFFDKILFPFWEWCTRQKFFSSDDGNKERFAFWELVPLSHTSFPEASRRAIQWQPSRIDHFGLLVHDLVNESTQQHPNELTDLLVALLNFDPHPHWQTKDWRRSWEALKDSGARRLREFENALARKGISLDGDNVGEV